MQGYNCILVYSEDRREILFCKRLNDPYEGMYNLVGGKIEPGEDGFHAAYRELFEENGDFSGGCHSVSYDGFYIL